MIQVFHGFHIVIKLKNNNVVSGDGSGKDILLEALVISYDRLNNTFGLEKRFVNGAFTMEFSKEHPMRWVRALDVSKVKRIRLEGKPVCVDAKMLYKGFRKLSVSSGYGRFT
jgi:predicted secreted protein